MCGAIDKGTGVCGVRELAPAVFAACRAWKAAASRRTPQKGTGVILSDQREPRDLSRHGGRASASAPGDAFTRREYSSSLRSSE